MTGVDVLAVLKDRGVVLQPQGDVVHYRAPKGKSYGFSRALVTIAGLRTQLRRGGAK